MGSVMEPNWYREHLACPDCLTFPFDPSERCMACGYMAPAPRDLRASTYSRRRPPAGYSTSPPAPLARLGALDTSNPGRIAGVTAPGRDSRELLTPIRERFPAGGDVLDLGCGPRDQFVPFNQMGFRYVGIDYDGTGADLLADGHALPFTDHSFDVVFSFAVLEHLHAPIRALAEISRVLRPGGIFVGTVSQGEPFHASYFHFTPWGLIAILDGCVELQLMRMWTSDDTLRSLSRMGRYPRVLRGALAMLDHIHNVAPWLAPRRTRLSRKDKEIDALYRAGSICFVIAKSPAR